MLWSGVGSRSEVAGGTFERLNVARLNVAGCRLQVAGCRLQVAGCRLQVAGCRLQVAQKSISRACDMIYTEVIARSPGLQCEASYPGSSHPVRLYAVSVVANSLPVCNNPDGVKNLTELDPG